MEQQPTTDITIRASLQDLYAREGLVLLKACPNIFVNSLYIVHQVTAPKKNYWYPEILLGCGHRHKQTGLRNGLAKQAFLAKPANIHDTLDVTSETREKDNICVCLLKELKSPPRYLNKKYKRLVVKHRVQTIGIASKQTRFP